MYYSGRIIRANIYCHPHLDEHLLIIVGYTFLVEVEVEYKGYSTIIRRSTLARSNAKSVRRARRRARFIVRQIQNWIMLQHYPAKFDTSVFVPV